MSATPESTLANPAQRIADLESQLAECKAELDKAQRNLNETTTERAEALARETATAEVLRIINSSPGDLAPVFDAILEKARTLCEGTFGALFLAEADELFRAVAMRGGTAAWHERIRRGFAGSETPASAPLLAGKRFVHIVDLAQIDHPMARAAVEAVGVRTFLSVPLRKDNTIVGMIFISRGEVRAFTDKQIALLQNFAAQAVIAMENARLLTETREALEQQTATAEVLGVINSSPGELKPVFDAILDKAHSLCGVEYGVLLTYDGELFWPVAMHGAPPSLEMRNGFRPSSGFRGLLRGERLLHIHDMAEVAAQRPDEPVYRDLFESGGILTQLAVPLRKNGRLLGIITANRREVKPFSDRQIALLENFAAQAVIAIENARLITETREALEQQTATAEVLQVINSSPDDLAPVFDAMLEKAMRLCGADFGVMNRYDGKHFYHAADNGVPSAYARYRRERGPITYGSGTTPARLVAGENLIHTADLMATEAYERGEPARRALVDLGGARTHLTAALRKGDVLLGDISIYRQEVRPFTDKQIALLQNFAAQAVIAMENARLLTETREALEQQTATAEVLQVINSSPGDLIPVFDAMLEKALQLCEADLGTFWTYDGDSFEAASLRGAPPEQTKFLTGRRHRPGAGTLHALLLSGENLVHIADLADTDAYRSREPTRRQSVDVAGARSVLAVPLRRASQLLGLINIYRREVRPFSDKQIALLQNFAAQAVIAMENGRLLTETHQALEQQTATAEVLQVINSSPGDLAPVFDTMLAKALRLCEAAFGILFVRSDEEFVAGATRGLPRVLDDYVRKPFRPSPDGFFRRAAEGQDLEQFEDLSAPQVLAADDPRRAAYVEHGAARTALNLALRKDGVVLGGFSIFRQEVRPFTDKQIALLQNFAAQAVIAMENARLITETREALEQQTATAEVLQVINASPGDLAPVFDAILRNAHSLCDISHGSLQLYDGEKFRAVAVNGMADLADRLRQGYSLSPNNPLWPLLEGERFVHVPDLAEIDDPISRSAAEIGGTRTLLCVALRKDDKLLGQIAAARREVRPFSEKEISLLQNFAAQAVIAMENARLLTETREALEQQTATAEVLGVINSSPGELAPVFDAILSKAQCMCSVDHAALELYDGERMHAVAVHGASDTFAETLRSGYPATDSPAARALLEGQRFAQIADAAEIDHIAFRTAAEVDGVGTVLFVPLRREDMFLGMIASARREVRRFSDKEIALLENFAAQAVIAMENARLLTETREALEQQTATAEVLQVINSSPGDLTPVFDAILEKAHTLCGAAHGGLVLYDGEYFRPGVSRGYPASLVERLRQGYRPAASHPMRRLLTGDPYVHVSDLAEVDDPAARIVVELGGIRTTLFVALRKDDELLGMFTAARDEVHPFSDKEITLLQNFAAQAVIAMDNARLLDEIRQRQAELRVTFDNMGDGVAMFDSELRLAAWNLNFQRILDVSDELLAERPNYSDYIRFLAQRGEFGNADIETELSRRLEAIGQELRFEHTRPDGRVIEVRRNAVPGGGFVIIYGDVTERKRAEAEIRDARDTAERALGELQTAQASLVHAQKMAALGQLTAGIAHEIKNPLNFVNNFAELSGDLLLELKETTAPAVAALGDDERAAVAEVVEMLRGNLDKIAEHGKRADGIVKSMLEHSRGVSGERRVVDLNALIEEALNLAYHGARAQDASFNITLEREFDRGLAPTELAPQEMTRVFLNLFGNGFYATTRRQRDGAGPDFRPTLRVATRDLGDAVEVRVRDNGTGVAPEIRDKLFQPFVTTKPTGEGTGLGLSIAYDIVTQQHGGTISVDSHVGEFTEFTIRLPCA